MSEGSSASEETASRGAGPWLTWLLGAAFLGSVIVVATHFSEQQEFVRVVRDAKPWWILGALALQALTYVAQGEIWRSVARMEGRHLSLAMVYKLALAKLFVDQALPSAGVSGTVVVAQLLERDELPRSAVLAGVVVNTTSFFIAYVVSLAASLVILFYFVQASAFIVTASLAFMAFSVGLVAAMLAMTGKDIGHRVRRLERFRIVRNALGIMRDADPRLALNVRVQVVASWYQLATFLLDAGTLWMLLRSLGAKANPSLVFESFMISNLARTVSIIPGGLGTFEGASVLMLRLSGVSVAAALSATLLFRGISFVLPMAPGLWFSRGLKKGQQA